MLDWFSGNTQINSLFWAGEMPSFWVALLGAMIIVLSLLAYRRTPGMPFPIRVILFASRLLALALLYSLLVEPTLSIEKTIMDKKRLPIMIDVSQSMSIIDQRKSDDDIVNAASALGFIETKDLSKKSSELMIKLGNQERKKISSTSRLELVQSLLTGSNESLKSLGEDLVIDYYSFGKSLKMIKQGDEGDFKRLSELKAVESSTTIADSLNTMAFTDRESPLSGILLLSDGSDTSLRTAESAISELGEHGVPIFPVPIGLSNPDDVSIRNVIIQEVAFSGDKVPVRVQLKSRGYEKRVAQLRVKLNDRQVTQRNITFEGGLQFEDIFFHVDLYEKGAVRVEVEIEAFSDEATKANNRIERSIRVVNEKINILCIEGSARWEYRYLRAMLKRDPRFRTTFIASRAKAEMARNSSEYIERFPETRDEAFKYDLVILGDVAADFFSNEEMKTLEELIKNRGGSLLVLCGSRDTPTSYGGTVIEKMLPVEFDAEGDWEVVDDGVYPVLTPEGRSSLVMTLESDQESNDRIWSGVAPLDQLPPIGPAKPGATVLASLSDHTSSKGGYPLVSWHRYGTGKCMAIATDRLWLLRFKLGDKYHWRVWSQTIQFLTLSRLMGEHKRIRLETDRTSYQTNEKVLLFAHVLDDEFNPVTRASFPVEVMKMGDNPVPHRISLVPNASKPGVYEGYFSPVGSGRYLYKSNADDEEVSNSTEFQVANVNQEMADSDMQIERLERIANISGGQVIPLRDFQKISSMIDRSQHISSIRTDIKLWEGSWLAFLVMALFGFEWIVRRKYDLP
jgi:hypothetical protein